MASETSTFSCPICETHLTMPTALAGVGGPCPFCGTKIQAPFLPAPPQVLATAPPVQYQAAAIGSAPAAPVNVPPPADQSVQTPSQETKPGYRPEPRQLPSRPEGQGQIVDKPVSEAVRELPEEHAHSRRGGPLIRILVPLRFLGAAIGVISGITSFLNSHTPTPRKGSGTSSYQSDASVRKIQPEDELPPSPPEPNEADPIIPPPAPPPMPVDPSSSPDSSPSPAISASRILERFLDASTLADRIPYLEGRTPQAELEKSSLAGPLAERVQIEPAMQTDNPIENFTDFVFKITFARQNGGRESFDVLVRRRGDQEPKVVVDPFLDLVGGRLLEFASNPAEGKQDTFQALVLANTTCSDTTIPNYERKISLKLIGEPTGREIATAYAGKSSMIGDMLNNEQSGLGWGRAKACTILLTWNTKEEPGHPYMEASAVKSLNWNP